MDLPLIFNTKKQPVWNFEASEPSRFAILDRNGKGKIQWFEDDPCYVFHVANTWDEGNEIILVACRTDNPGKVISTDSEEFDLYKAYPTEWRFNTATGALKRKQLNSKVMEFPVINPLFRTQKTRYMYGISNQADDHVSIHYKVDLETGETVAFHQHFTDGGENAHAYEMIFVPDTDSKTKNEDDGYLVGFVHESDVNDSNGGITFLKIIDARNMNLVAKVLIPYRIPYGFHGIWLNEEELESQTKKFKEKGKQNRVTQVAVASEKLSKSWFSYIFAYIISRNN